MITLQETITITDILLLENWFNDKATYSRMSGMLPLSKFIPFVTHAPNRIVRLAFSDNDLVGFVDIETTEDQHASISLIVNPEKRGQRYGQQILQAILALPKVEKIYAIHAYIEPDNAVALECFKKVGFIQYNNQIDKDGFIDFVYTF